MMDSSNVSQVVARDRGDEIVVPALEASPLSIVLTDPRQDDNPITYVNAGFETVTLYSRAFALGRNCRFLQGEKTDRAQIKRIADAIREEREISLDIVNYKADGSEFVNRLMIAPLWGEGDEVIAFVGIQKELDARERQQARDGATARLQKPPEDTMLAEVQHRVKNHLAMLVGMIRMQAEREVTRQSFEALSHRVRGLALLYDELSGSRLARRSDDTVAAGAYLSRICNSLAAIEGRSSIRVNVDCDDIDMPVDLAARLGLLVTEFVTNALQHAFEGRDRGAIHVKASRLPTGGVRVVVADDGRGLPEGSNWPWSSGTVEGKDGLLTSSGLGGTIIVTLAESMDADISVAPGETGTVVTITLPMD
jgi:PAS domain S-box-containing protein